MDKPLLVDMEKYTFTSAQTEPDKLADHLEILTKAKTILCSVSLRQRHSILSANFQPETLSLATR